MRRPLAMLVAALAFSAPAVVPALAGAQGTGGAAAPGPPPPPPPPPPGATPSEPIPAAGAPAAVPGAPSLAPPDTAMVRRTVEVTGSVDRSDIGKDVVVELRKADGSWEEIATATSGADGSYAVRWRPRRPGRFTLRAQLAGASAAQVDAVTPTTVTVYRRDKTTWYGPDDYGTRTACGQMLERDTIGVAHKTLPCGTEVEFVYRDRKITVPVIDRGPYANGAVWDLTVVAMEQLGVLDTVHLGAAVVERGSLRRR